MTQNILRGFCCAILILVFAFGFILGCAAQENETNSRQLTVYLQSIFDAKVSLRYIDGFKNMQPISEEAGVKNGKSAKIKIPGQYLPGEFLLRIDYRVKEIDSPYPAERIIFINKQNIKLSVNPPYINNNEKTKFNPGEKENTVYAAFVEENSAKRAPIDLLKQFLLSYDRSESKLYIKAVKEFEQRRIEYNAWLAEQTKQHRNLFVSRLFQFQYIPSMVWSGDEKEYLGQLIKNYFEGIDFNDPLIIRLRELAMFMDGYIRLYGMQATTPELRDSLFTQAGRLACEKASRGVPQVYGWMVDYFYNGYEANDIKEGMIMLQEHINNPRCLTSKKQQIVRRLESLKKLVPGALAPDFLISDNQGNSFQFHKFESKARYKLLLFWSAGCSHCLQLVGELKEWQGKPANRKKLDVIGVGLDEVEENIKKWKTAIATLPEWKHLHVKEGVNSRVARDYAILSTPAMFLVKSKSNIIAAVPANFEQLINDLK